MHSPSWKPATRIFMITLLLVAAIWLLVRVAPLVEALAVAALVAFLLEGLVAFFVKRRGMARPKAVILVYILFLLFIVTVPAGIGTVAVSQVNNLIAALSDAWGELQTWLTRQIVILGIRINPQSLVTQLNRAGEDTLALITGNSVNLVAGITTNLYWAIFVLISVYYFMKDGFRLVHWVISVSPREYRQDVRRLLKELNAMWRVALRVQIFIFLILAALIIVGTALILWLFQSGLIGFSPLLFILLMVALYTGVQQVDNLWLRPRWMGHYLAIHPAIIFIGLMGSLAVGGLLGVLVIVPLIGTAKVLGGYIYAKLLDVPPWREDVLDPEDQAVSPAEEEPIKSG